MMRSLFSGVSGLKAHQTGMDVIGNNIANVNTTGFKSSRATFADMFSQTLTGASAGNGDVVGGTNPKQIGLGSVVSSIDLMFTDGSPQTTGKNTDMALQGNGLFIVKQGKQTYYTRNGDFQFDQAGNFVNSAGLFVQGWTAKDGVVNTSDQPSRIQLSTEIGMPAKATTSVNYMSNLNAAAPYIQSMTVLDGNGNSVKVNATNTDPWSIGSEPSSTTTPTIDKETITFAGNITLDEAKGRYKMGGNYNVDGDKLVSVTLEDDDVVTGLPANSKTLETDYAAGQALPTDIASISGTAVSYKDGSKILDSQNNTYTVTLDLNGTKGTISGPSGSYTVGGKLGSSVATLSSGSVVLATGDTLTGFANTTANFKVTLSNGDVVTNGGGTYAGTYETGAAVTSDIQTVKQSAVTYANGDSITSSGNTYSAQLNNRDTLHIGQSSTKTYTSNGTLPAGLKVTSVVNSKVTLSDGSTIITSTPNIYQTGQALPAAVNSLSSKITADTPVVVKSIDFNTVPQVESIAAVNTQKIKSQTKMLTVILSNSDVVSVPKTSTSQYTVGTAVQAAITSVNTAAGTYVTFKDGAYINGSNSKYTVTLNNGDTVELGGGTASNYVKGSSIGKTNAGLAVKSVKGASVTLSNDDTLTNNSGSTYKALLSNGDTLILSASSSTTYTVGSNMPATVTVKAINGKQVMLSDGSVITASDTSQYTPGSAVTALVKSFTGLPTSTVATITSNPEPIVSEISGKVVSDDGTDSFDTKNSGASIKPASGLTTSGITLSVNGGTEVAVSSSDKASYKQGSEYAAGTIKSITLNMSDGTKVNETTGSYTNANSMPVATTMKVFDQLGNEHNIVLYFTKIGIGDGTDEQKGNTWRVSLNPDGSNDACTLQDASGASKNPQGESAYTAQMNAVDLRFTPDGKVESGNQSQPTLTLYNGAGSPQTVTLDFSQMTQYASGSTVTNVSDGNGFGNLASVSIDEQGRIIGSYTNDVKQVEGQVAIAQFSNASGLTKAGNSLYQQSNNSGTPKVGDNTTLGVGLTTSALEMSNVDIANEFSNMITTQRGFQSNSKIITVSDEMLETLINMKR